MSQELVDVVMERGASARQTWPAVEMQFLGNRETRALYLNSEFHNFEQGDLSITDYCRKLKGMANALSDLGEHVSEHTLVLNLIRGLNERFKPMRLHFKRAQPFPTSLQARNDLLLEELTTSKRAASTTASAFVAATTSASGSTTTPATAPPAPDAPKPPNSNKGKHAKRGKGGSSGQSSSGNVPGGGSSNSGGGSRGWRPSLVLLPQQQAMVAGGGYWSHPAPPPPYGGPASVGALPFWDQQSLANSFTTMTLQQPQQHEWYLDTGATSHMTSDLGTLAYTTPSRYPSIVVGNGALLPISTSGVAHLPGPFHLHDVLVAPNLIKNLISVHRFTTDNSCSIEFDPFGCSVKDLQSRNVIAMCNSSGPLYPLHLPASALTPLALHAAATTSTLWHRRLGLPSHEVLSRLVDVSCVPHVKHTTSLCHACQLGRHVRLPFSVLSSRATRNFQLIHCDLWTSPRTSVSGYKYYLVILDDCSHFLWKFPLRLKSDTFPTLTNFFAYVSTQFGTTIQGIQCDNGRKFDNSAARTFFLTHGANLPPSYWVEALNTATYLLNLLPTTNLQSGTPYQALFGSPPPPPSYDHLRVFSCCCYPTNLSATASHKLAPRPLVVSFSDTPLTTKDTAASICPPIVHVVFDETSFPFAEQTLPPSSTDTLEFLADYTNAAPEPIGPRAPSVFYRNLGRPHCCATCGCWYISHVICKVTCTFSTRAYATRGSWTTTWLPRAHATHGWSSSTGLPRALATRSHWRAIRCALDAHRIDAQLLRACATRGNDTWRTLDAYVACATRGTDVPGSPPSTQPCAAPVAPLPAAAGAPAAPVRRFSGQVYTWRPVHGPVRSSTRPSPVHVPVHGPSLVEQRLPKGAVQITPVINSHRMTTRAKLGFRQPALFAAAPLTPVPKSFRSALADPNWRAAMEEEHAALLQNHTWDLHKFKADGSLEWYKARWVLRGFTQCPSIDYDETFSPVVKPATVRTVLSLALSRGWAIHQLDVKNAFLHGTLTEMVYCQQPSGIEDPSRPIWVETSTACMAKSDTSLFVFHRGADTVYLLLYVDDIVLTASSLHLLRRTIEALQQEFAMKDMGELHHFLGMKVQRCYGSLLLTQHQYMLDILERAGITSLSLGLRSPMPCSRFVSICMIHGTSPCCPQAHLKDTLHLGLLLRPSPQSDIVVYSDADWADCPDTRKSTSGYAVFLGDNLISWSSKRQNTVSRSNAEAEYRVVANAVVEASWLWQLLQELHSPPCRATLVYCDNISAVYMSSNPVQHQRTKHIEIDLHFVRERVSFGDLRVLHVPTSSQYANIFTKGLPSSFFTEFRSSLNVFPLENFTSGQAHASENETSWVALGASLTEAAIAAPIDDPGLEHIALLGSQEDPMKGMYTFTGNTYYDLHTEKKDMSTKTNTNTSLCNDKVRIKWEQQKSR
ncbi:LOW QUALITY PROTEIN: hypothetical protein U9M48_004304, partial [Paspalum notatum var. saurae]